MATRKKPEPNKPDARDRQQVRFFIQPGTRVQITLEVGEELQEGKVPVTINIDQVLEEGKQAVEILQPAERSTRSPHLGMPGIRASFEKLKARARNYDLATWLFVFALVIYLLTRLIGLTQFPIYFFTDEAIQSQSMIDLIEHDYQDPSGTLLPTYFKNGEYTNLSLSVYLQWLPAILFGKSALATRVTSVLVTLIGAIAVGILLRDVFKLKYWWTGTLFLSITPAWFLHSRTAFETVEFVAFYAGTLCAYLFYRYKSARYLYLAIFLGALAFYSYSPAQVIVPLTAFGFLVSDWRYHWTNRRTVLFGLGLGAVLALPYVRSSLNNPNAPFAHLHTLGSYWFERIPLTDKIGRYLSVFRDGLSPWYWYIPNDRDLARHLMKGYGHIMLATSPFALLGLAHILRTLRQPASRTILIAFLISPAAAALVQISITRALVFVVPVAVLTAIGFERVLKWVEEPNQRLAELSAGPGPNAMRIAAALGTFLAGIVLAFLFNKTLDRFALVTLATLLALPVSGLIPRLAEPLRRLVDSTRMKAWNPSQAVLALSSFVILAGANISMLNDALRNGPLWFRDYGLGGMQYGAFQIFDILEAYAREHPDTRIIFSPDWANGADILARYFLSDPTSIEIGSVRGHITQKLPLDDRTLFVLTPQEFDLARESVKFTDIRVERIVPYPDGQPGFYFIRLRYSDGSDSIFAAESAARKALQESFVNLDGQEVKLRFSYLDSDSQAASIAAVFDNDPYTVAKTFESNPFVIEMTFPEPRTINGFSIIIGSAKVQVTLNCYPEPGAQPVAVAFEGQGSRNQPELSFDLPEAIQAQVLRVEVLDLLAPAQTKVHVWELKLR